MRFIQVWQSIEVSERRKRGPVCEQAVQRFEAGGQQGKGDARGERARNEIDMGASEIGRLERRLVPRDIAEEGG